MAISRHWEHLQDVLLKTYNRIVREEFKDIDLAVSDTDIATARTSLRSACLIKDDDTATMTVVRMFLFYVILGQAKRMQGDVYGVPCTTFQETYTYIPQISLYFIQDFQDVDPDYAPVQGHITIRWKNQTATTVSKSDIVALARKIRTLFGGTTPEQWKKGKILYTYTHKAEKYHLQILSINETEAKGLIGKVLDIQNDTPDWQYLRKNEAVNNSDTYPIVPPRKTILGKSKRQPRRRPVATVKFTSATVDMLENRSPIVLLDRSNRYDNPVIDYKTGEVLRGWD